MYIRKVSNNAVKVPMRALSTKPEISSAALIQQIAEQQKEKAAKIVPWFLTNMPAPYFKQVAPSIQTQHVQAIATMRDMASASESMSMRIGTQEGDRHHITFISSDTSTGNFNSQVKALGYSKDEDLANVNVFTTLDNSLALNVFSFNKGKEKTASKEDAKHLYQFVEEVKAGKHAADKTVPVYSEIFNEKNLAEYVSNITPNYARQSNPRRFMIQREMYEKVRGTEGSVVHMEPFENNQTWVTIAAANVLPEVLLRLSSAILHSRGIQANRVHLDSVLDKSNSTPDTVGNVTMLRLLLANKPGQDLNAPANADFANTLSADLKRAKWIDNETYDLGLTKFPQLGLDKAEVITALCSMLHGPLNKQNAQAFTSIKAILQIVESHKSHVDIAGEIAQLYLDKFNPKKPLAAASFTARADAIKSKVNLLPNEHAVAVLNKMVDGVDLTLRSNFYNEDRYALSARVHPSIMATGEIGKSDKKPLPFGVFFVHGRNFNGFHNRFRDIARGGLRIVTPANSDLHALESSRQYDEVYGLSHAQQLKNKDIPEGGAKGVILVSTHNIEAAAKNFAMRKAVKAFTDSMLDLIVDSSVSKLVDYYNKPELIYFGPDEQIIPFDIDWIIKRAAIRGYPLPDALMSSKADNGINHKEFGVTSEGIVVYLDVALRKSLGIDPKKQPFTVKVTGGPDGDVAGNLIRILNRDYGKNAKIVGIADGFGVAEDPEGLDHDELLRLFKAELPITSFNSAKLNKGGVCLPVTSEEGFNRRNTMHNRVKADAFVPAGGRPNTMNADNWQNFLDADGQPTSRLIVEGANIFITPEARKNLFEKAKVAIVKDSSANKCGVVTSSCEVQGSMLLSKAEFMKIKPEIVNDVLVHLRKIARSEAELLFREYNNYPGALPDFSERISKAIAKVDDAISAHLENVTPEDPLFKELQPLIREGLPKKMVDVAGDRINKNFPVPYQKNAIACALASKLVYQEGIHLVEIQPPERLAERAFQYYRQDQKIKQLIAELNSTEGPLTAERKAVIVDILSRAGARASLNIF